MKTKTSSANLHIVFSLCLILILLVGCGTVEAGVVKPDPGTPERANTVSVGMDESGVGTIEVGIEPTPPPESSSYINNIYDFTFDYPETWTLTEQDHGVVLQKGSNRLGINFRWADEQIDQFGRTGMGAGDPIYVGKVNFMNRVIPAEALLYEKKTKAVFYGGVPGLVDCGDMVFMIALEDLETNYVDVDLSDEIISETGAILT